MDESNIMRDELLIEKNGELVLGNASDVVYENLPPVRKRPEDSDRAAWIDYLVDLGASREYLIEHIMTMEELVHFANSLEG